MPRSYSGDLRERVIEAVEMEGASRREAAERFEISVSSAVKWLQRWNESQERGAEARVAEVCLRWKRTRIGYWLSIAERPDLTLKETLVGAAPATDSNQQECAFPFFCSA